MTRIEQGQNLLKMIEAVDVNDTDTLDEIWKPFPLNKLYSVSNKGRIKHIKGNLKKIQINRAGYCRITLYENGNSVTYSVASIVAQTFIGERPENYVIDHIDGDKLNNSVGNLEYVTQRENIKRLHIKKRGSLGVYFCKKTKRYNAQISVRNEKITLGWFDTEDEAAAAYIGAEKAITKWVK